MTQEFIDDVTGELIGGDTTRFYSIGGLDNGSIGNKEVADLDTLLTIIRDHLESKAPAPLDIYTMSRLPTSKPALAKYAPPAPEPEPERRVQFWPGKPAYAPSIPFPPLGRSEYVTPPAASERVGYLRRQAARSDAENEALKARADKARTKYIAALTAQCGCGDSAAHEGNLL